MTIHYTILSIETSTMLDARKSSFATTEEAIFGYNYEIKLHLMIIKKTKRNPK